MSAPTVPAAQLAQAPVLPPRRRDGTGRQSRHTASTITDADLDWLYARVADLEERLAAYEDRPEAAA
jgi:hypothetical protein